MNFLLIEREPAQFRTDGLSFELGRTPNEGGASGAQQGGAPIRVDEDRTKHNQRAQPHHVGPPEIAKVAFAANDPNESESDDEEGSKAEEETKKVQNIRNQWSVASLMASSGVTGWPTGS